MDDSLIRGKVKFPFIYILTLFSWKMNNKENVQNLCSRSVLTPKF
jgi:hypothetical protein